MIIAGKYEVVSELGRGGMGVVYQARHVKLGAVCAVKTVPAHLAQESDVLARFQQEARVMASLRHPNIVRVVDVGEDAGVHFLIMEYVDGQSLRQVLQETRVLRIEDALAIALDVASALRHAHQQTPAIVHRDIKPSNIMIERTTGRAIVTDFGIAKLVGHEGVVHTKTGMLVGTMRYCAPEQLAGAKVDGRADLFALGLVLYEMLTGCHPLEGLDEPQIVARVLDTKDEIELVFPTRVPSALQRLIVRTVSKSRNKRYTTAESIIVELQQIVRLASADTVARDAEGTTTAHLRVRQRTIFTGAAVALTLLVFAIGFVSERSGYLARAGRRIFPTVNVIDASAKKSGGTKAAQVSSARAVGVMEFAALNSDPSVGWMRDIIRANLSSQLSAASDCKVFSKEFIDFKAQGLVKKGAYSNLQSATMEVAEELGITKVIFGQYRTSGDQLYIDAHVVDMQTGLQEPADQVRGEVSRFTELQSQLATKIMTRLDIRPPAAVALGPGADIDGYKMLLDAEGGAGSSAGAGHDAKPTKDSSATSGVSLFDALFACFESDPAYAGESDDVAINETLQKYRRAYEEKNLELLAEVYGSLSPEQSTAATQYFAAASQLVVQIQDVDIAVDGDRAVVSYTRRDQFQDAKTGKAQNLQVRLTKMLVRHDGAWVIAQATK